MTQHSEERLPETDGAPSVRNGARILPFERPQSELQRAIEQRAQEALDRDAELEREKRRPQPLKWLTICARCVPVLLTIVAVDGFLRVFHKVACYLQYGATGAGTAAGSDERRAVAVPTRHRDAGVFRRVITGAARRHAAERGLCAGRRSARHPAVSAFNRT